MIRAEALRYWDDAVQDTAQAWVDQCGEGESPTDDFMRLGLDEMPDEVLGTLALADPWRTFRADVLRYFEPAGE